MDKNMKDLFDLNVFGESSDKDDTSGQKEVSIPVPGGDSETPKSKPYDAASISIPSSKEIPINAYNEILGTLQKSYKESAELIGMLMGVKPVEETTQNLQERFTESVIEDAIYESYINGPYYEAASDPNKAEIKKIVSTIQKKLKTIGDKYHLTPSTGWRKLMGRGEDIKSKAWQTVGVFYCKPSEVTKAIKYFSKEYEDDLGEMNFSAGKLEVDSGATNPHLKNRWGWGLLAFLFGAAVGGGIGGFVGGAGLATAGAAIGGISGGTNGIAGEKDSENMKKKRDGTPYILLVTSGATTIAGVTIKLTKEDINKVDKVFEDKDKSKEMKESVEFIELFSEAKEEDDSDKKKGKCDCGKKSCKVCNPDDKKKKDDEEDDD